MQKNGGLILPKGIFFETFWATSSTGFEGLETFFLDLFTSFHLDLSSFCLDLVFHLLFHHLSSFSSHLFFSSLLFHLLLLLVVVVEWFFILKE